MKIYVKSTQAIFAGTRYDKQAAALLVAAGFFDSQINADAELSQAAGFNVWDVLYKDLGLI